MLLARKYTAVVGLMAFVAALSGAGPAVACASDCAPAAVHPCAPQAKAHPCEPAAAVPPCHAPDLLKGACCGAVPDRTSQEALTARVAPPDAPSFKTVPCPLAFAFAPPRETFPKAPAQTGAPPGTCGNALYLSLSTLLI